MSWFKPLYLIYHEIYTGFSALRSRSGRRRSVWDCNKCDWRSF